MAVLTLQTAFDIVVQNCGLNAAESRRLRAHARAAKKICELARKSPEYQRHVVGRLLVGERNPFDKRIAASILVYETVGFYEVTSRLRRAVGMVRREVEYLDRMIASGSLPDRLPDRLLTLDLIAEQAKTLYKLLADVEVTPRASRKKPAQRKRSASQVKSQDKLHSPASLGLITKNVLNVATLQAAHRPTAEEKQLALSLAEKIRQLAVEGLDAGRKAFGPAHEGCRVRPRGRPVRRVIAHSDPDGDAVVVAWLAEQFLFGGEAVEVLFVPRERVLGAYRRGDCLVDVGNTHDPANSFFDHKPPALPDRHDSCAAKLVWEHLRARGCAVEHLRPLINAVFAGDSRRQQKPFAFEYNRSKQDGLHAVLHRTRSSEATGAEVYRAARRWLDGPKAQRWLDHFGGPLHRPAG